MVAESEATVGHALERVDRHVPTPSVGEPVEGSPERPGPLGLTFLNIHHILLPPDAAVCIAIHLHVLRLLRAAASIDQEQGRRRCVALGRGYI